jgi:hypothetical protein
MRNFVLLLIPLAMVAAAEKAADKKDKPAQSQDRSAAQPARQAQPAITSIPSDAVQIGPQVYRYTDADGKNWIYRKTPFGISKVEERETSTAPFASPAPSPRPNADIKVRAIENKDGTVRFEQGTPMGTRVWERKKSELTPEEKAWLEQSKNKDSAKPEK